MGFLHRVAQAIYRTPEELRRQQSPWASRAKHAMFALAFVATFAVFCFFFFQQIRDWRDVAPVVPFPKGGWRVHYGPTPETCVPGKISKGCLANPGNPGLWTSEPRIMGRDHWDRSRGAGEYWVGVDVPAALIREAWDRNARHLYIGNIRADYRIWIDGEVIVEGRARDYTPIWFPVGSARLLSGRGMKLAIQIYPDPDSFYSDVLAGYMGEGFTTHERANAFRGGLEFWRRSRPFALFLANMLVAGIFFFLWTSARERQEYFYMALFAVVSAAFQLRSMDLVLSRISSGLNRDLFIVLKAWQAALLMFLGFAFARFRRPVFSWGIPMMIALPVAFVLSPAGLLARHEMLNRIEDWIAPALYSVGALACAIQAVYLATAGGRSHLPSRTRRLSVAALAILAIAVLEIVIARDQRYSNIAFRVLFTNFGHFALVVFLGLIATVEYRRERALIEKTPISRYHRRPSLPERLHGAILVADLKNSERLFRMGSLRGKGGTMVEACLSHLWSAVIKEGGVVLQTEGDQIRAFFDSDDHPEPAVSALRAADRMAAKLRELAERFSDQGLAPDGRFPLDFRGGLALGEIAPVWHEMGGTRYASWIEVGSLSPFVESARHMELERGLGAPGGGSAVVLSAELGRKIGGVLPGDRWHDPGRPFEGKHGRVYTVVAYLPSEAPGAAPAAEDFAEAA